MTRRIARLFLVTLSCTGSIHATTSTTSAGTSQTATFSEKCAQPGVLRCDPFDSDTELRYNWPTGGPCPDSYLQTKTLYSLSRDRHDLGNAVAIVQNGQCYYPQIDTNTKFEGAGSLKFTIPSNSSANSSGYFTEPFQRPFVYAAPQAVAGSTATWLGTNVIWFQYRQRFDTNFVNIDYVCTGGGCGGWKQAIWYGNPPAGSSSSSIEVTQNNGWERNVPQMYGQQGSDSYGIEDVINCTYANATSQGGAGSGHASRPNYSAPLNPTCAHYPPDQWVEFTGRIEVRGAANAAQSRVQLWVDGTLVIDYAQAKINWGSADGDGIGSYHVSPYSTNKDPSQTHPTGYTWYDSLIVSTQPISMGTTAPAPPVNFRVN